jgi:AhpD family alkylhydroperoxidase
MTSPVLIIPDALQALYALGAAAKKTALPAGTIGLIQLRASQINGCGVCVDMHARGLIKAGETDERLFTIAAWRDAPYFTEAERAALALTEAITRLSDGPDGVSDEIWNEAAKHYGEESLAVLVLNIALINFWNRVNVATKQVAGEWVKSREAQEWMEKQAGATLGEKKI